MKHKHIGEQIKTVREIKKITQEELASHIGMTANYISAIECGVKSPSLETLIKIINSLEVSADEMFMDIIDHVYPIKSTILSNDIQTLPAEEQRRIFAVVEAMINDVKKKT